MQPIANRAADSLCCASALRARIDEGQERKIVAALESLAAEHGVEVSPEALWRHRGTLVSGGLPTWRG